MYMWYTVGIIVFVGSDSLSPWLVNRLAENDLCSS